MKMSGLKLGTLRDGRQICIDKSSPNQHISIFGVSGIGKSTCINSIQKSIISQGGTVVRLDLDGDKNGFFVSDDFNVISALEDGLEFSFLERKEENGELENLPNFISYTTDILSGTMGLGVRQQGSLRIALEYAIDHRHEYDTEMEAICVGLEMQGSVVAQSVLNKLWNILKSGVFRRSDRHMKRGKINSISLKGINPTTQRELAEIILANIWRKARNLGRIYQDLTIVIDEFQNLSLKRNSTLYEMLREARGYGINLMLATQSMAGFSSEIKAAIDQTAVQIYFRPSNSDIAKIVKYLQTGNEDQWSIVLRNLQVGQAVATGNLNLQGKRILRPLVIQTGCVENQGERSPMIAAPM